MKLIVGLGNPGDIYRDSRHNIGFSVVKALAKARKISLKRDKGTFSLSGRGKIDSQNVIMATPLSFMNLSGAAVKALLKKYKIALRDILIVADDLDLEFGRLRIRPSGSSAGQRGLVSITESLGTQEFARLRIGIGRPNANMEASDYVLSPFNRKEKAQLKQIIENAADCCKSWITKGITETMNIFNARSRYNE
jgi:PTH1 family peptidyl-tRNA hydrolase